MVSCIYVLWFLRLIANNALRNRCHENWSDGVDSNFMPIKRIYAKNDMMSHNVKVPNNEG